MVSRNSKTSQAFPHEGRFSEVTYQFSLLMWSPKPGVSITVNFIRTPFSSISAQIITPQVRGVTPSPQVAWLAWSVSEWAVITVEVMPRASDLFWVVPAMTLSTKLSCLGGLSLGSMGIQTTLRLNVPKGSCDLSRAMPLTPHSGKRQSLHPASVVLTVGDRLDFNRLGDAFL